jgi:hypothetical protein
MATVGPTNIPAYLDSDAAFRTWGSTISAALATLGLVQTSDTGQINWTTVSHPSAGQIAGYEMWRFADSLQATAPVFIKIEYGTGVPADRPSVWTTVGTGVDGAGTLTGQVSNRLRTAATSSKAAGVVLPMYVGGNAGELSLAYNIDVATTSCGAFFAVERTKDATGTPTADGVLLSTIDSAGVGATSQCILPSGTVPTAQGWAGIPPALWARSASGANAGVCPLFIPILAQWFYSRILLTGGGDFLAGGTFTATVFGGTHTYMALDRACGPVAVEGVAGGFAMRWE